MYCTVKQGCLVSLRWGGGGLLSHGQTLINTDPALPLESLDGEIELASPPPPPHPHPSHHTLNLPHNNLMLYNTNFFLLLLRSLNTPLVHQPFLAPVGHLPSSFSEEALSSQHSFLFLTISSCSSPRPHTSQHSFFPFSTNNSSFLPHLQPPKDRHLSVRVTVLFIPWGSSRHIIQHPRTLAPRIPPSSTEW